LGYARIYKERIMSRDERRAKRALRRQARQEKRQERRTSREGLGPILEKLCNAAEVLFGSGEGAEKKEWVIDAFLEFLGIKGETEEAAEIILSEAIDLVVAKVIG
jgi:hypothetical protein